MKIPYETLKTTLQFIFKISTKKSKMTTTAAILDFRNYIYFLNVFFSQMPSRSSFKPDYFVRRHVKLNKNERNRLDLLGLRVFFNKIVTK